MVSHKLVSNRDGVNPPGGARSNSLERSVAAKFFSTKSARNSMVATCGAGFGYHATFAETTLPVLNHAPDSTAASTLSPWTIRPMASAANSQVSEPVARSAR